MRTVQDRDESIHSDNMEKLIPWWLEWRLKDNSKVEIKYSEYKEFTKLNVLGYNICCLHGDLDNFKNIAGIGLSGTINDKSYLIGNNKLFDKYKINNNMLREEKKLSLDGNSIVYVIEDKKIIALIGVKDIIRDNAKEVVYKLKHINKRVIMLTGDNEITANIIANSIGINEIIFNRYERKK